jgi:hypothetical protein
LFDTFVLNGSTFRTFSVGEEIQTQDCKLLFAMVMVKVEAITEQEPEALSSK